MPTYNPDNPQEHSSGAVKRPQQRFIRLGWRKVSDWGIESLCGRFRLARYSVCGDTVYALWDGHAAVWRGSDAAEGKALAGKLWNDRQDVGSA